MITRRASEIIRLAQTLSQIQNTDALSWRDKIDMLNQSYVRLYDDINNSGDLYYSKEIHIEPHIVNHKHSTGEETIKLPRDFWKLLLVGYKSVFGEVVPLERAPNAGQYFSGYRVVNNKLIINDTFAPGPLTIRYIPQPQTITFPRKGYKIGITAVQAAYDSFSDVIVLGYAGGFTVINNSKGATVNRIIEGNFILALSHGIIYIVKETGIFCFDYNLTELSTLVGTFDLYAHSIGWEDGIIVTQENIAFKYVSGGELEPSENYWNFWEGVISKGEAGFVYSNEGEVKELTEIFENADSFVIADPYIYVNKGGAVTVYDKFELTDISQAIVGAGSKKGIVLAAEANNETGYGVVFRDFYSGINLFGFAADTVMNYPQNIFFDWLIADLAVKFRITLDIPTNELPALAEDYHQTLMKGLSRDAYKAQRINNVYARAYI